MYRVIIECKFNFNQLRWCLIEYVCQGSKMWSILSSPENLILCYFRTYLYFLTFYVKQLSALFKLFYCLFSWLKFCKTCLFGLTYNHIANVEV